MAEINHLNVYLNTTPEQNNTKTKKKNNHEKQLEPSRLVVRRTMAKSLWEVSFSDLKPLY